MIENSINESDSLPQSTIGARRSRTRSSFNRKHTVASATTRFTSVTGTHPALVRHLQPVDRFGNRIPWRLVCDLADQLGSQRGSIIQRDMNKVIEVDFLPRETDAAFSWLDSISDSTRRILIVDNDKNTTHLVKILLEKTGRYLVFEENDSTKAHQTARNFRPDLIFLDVVMPDRDGGEIAAQIQADPELQNTPIIFLTALVTRAEANAGLHIDGHSFLAKPINLQELIHTIERYLPLPALGR
jgi:CheY-like chemotaxis protein